MKITDKDKKELLQIIYPIGSYYYSNDSSQSPASIIGGTWEQVTNTFLLPSSSGVSTTIQNNGQTTRRLTSSQIASHTHTYSHSHSGGSHSHSWSGSTSHTHTYASHTHTGSTSSHTHTGWSVGFAWTIVKHTYYYVSGGSTPEGYNFDWSTMAVGINAAQFSGKTNAAAIGGTASAGSGSTSSYSGSSTTSSSVSMQSEGSGSSFNIMPVYKGCYLWRRTS